MTTRDIALADQDGHFLAGRKLVPLFDARAVARLNPAAVRAWAQTGEFRISNRGRLGEDIVRAYRDATRAPEHAGLAREDDVDVPDVDKIMVPPPSVAPVATVDDIDHHSEGTAAATPEDDDPVAVGAGVLTEMNGRLLLW